MKLRKKSENMEKYVLIGLDGSGKSTNLDKMKRDPRFCNFSFAWVRWEPKLLKPLYRLVYSRKQEGQAEIQDKRLSASAQYQKTRHLKKRIFSSKLVGWIWLRAALADYLIQFSSKYSALKKVGKHIVFDRFYYDLFLDQGINVGLSAEQIAKLIDRYAVLFPKVDQVIYIRTKPETCFMRKDDIAHMDYLLSRYEVYELLSHLNNWTVVDGERPLETVYDEITFAVLYSRGENL